MNELFEHDRRIATRKTERAPTLAPPVVERGLAGPGRSLDRETREHFEPKFGHSFADVRVHHDHDAAAASRAVGAAAFTVGRRIAFAQGRYEPRSASGRRLIGHELAHVVQQRSARPPEGRLRVAAPDDAAERAASRSTGAARRPPGAVPEQIVQRQLDPTQQAQQPAAPVSTPAPAAGPAAGPAFSVDQAAFERRVAQAIAGMRGAMISSETLAPHVVPILEQALARATWQDEHGGRHGGGVISYAIPGSSGPPIRVQLVLDDMANPPDDGRFSPAGGMGTIFVRVRRPGHSQFSGEKTVEDLRTILFHESLHLMRWIMASRGTGFVGRRQERAAQALQMGGFGTQIASIRRELQDLAAAVNARRGATPITPGQLDSMAPWLMEEVQTRAETEVFSLISQMEGQRGAAGITLLQTHESVEIGTGFLDRYVFEFSRVFRPGDRAGQTPQEAAILARLLEILRGFFRRQVERRFDVGVFTRPHGSPPGGQYQQRPLTPPTFRPLPLP